MQSLQFDETFSIVIDRQFILREILEVPSCANLIRNSGHYTELPILVNMAAYIG